MATYAAPVPQVAAHHVEPKQEGWTSWITTTDHKRIGIMYMVLTFMFFCLGGVEALMMRLQLGAPNNTLVSPETYNQLFTMHGTTMIFLFVVPMMAGLANYFVPLMIGARDMAFPRLNALSFWLLLAGGIVFYASLFWNPPEAGWSSYAPLSSAIYSPSGGQDAWIYLIHLTGLSSIVGRDQLLRDDREHAREGHVLGPAAAVHLGDPDLLGADHLRDAGDRRRGDDAAHRSPLRHALLRPDRGRLGAAVATPVLVLRTPRGLHHGAARVRAGLGDPARVRAKADLRLQGDRGLDRGDRLPRLPHLGAPHVHDADARGDPRVRDALLVPDRGADGREDAQLDRDAVARDDRIQDAAAVLRRLPRAVRDRRHLRRVPRRVPRRLAAERNLLRRRPPALRARRRLGVHDLRRDLLLVPEDHRADARRTPRQD